MRAERLLGSDLCSWRRSKRSIAALVLLVPLAHAATPGLALALTYVIAPGATFDPVGAPPAGVLPLTGHFEMSPWGVCVPLCEPDEYAMTNVVLTAGSDPLTNGVIEAILAGLVVFTPAFEVLPDGSVVAGGFPVERTITSMGTLTDDIHHHTHFESFVERSFAPLLFATGDPREVLYADPRGTFPIEVILAYTLILKTGTTHSGWDGTGGAIFGPGIVDQQSQILGYVMFTAHPVPEPGTGLLVLTGTLGLALRRRYAAE